MQTVSPLSQTTLQQPVAATASAQTAQTVQFGKGKDTVDIKTADEATETEGKSAKGGLIKTIANVAKKAIQALVLTPVLLLAKPLISLLAKTDKGLEVLADVSSRRMLDKLEEQGFDLSAFHEAVAEALDPDAAAEADHGCGGCDGDCATDAAEATEAAGATEAVDEAPAGDPDALPDVTAEDLASADGVYPVEDDAYPR